MRSKQLPLRRQGVARARAARQGLVLAVGFIQSHFVKGRLVFLGNPQGRTVRQNKFWTVQPQSNKFLRAKNLTKSAALMHVLKNQAHMARKRVQSTCLYPNNISRF